MGELGVENVRVVTGATLGTTEGSDVSGRVDVPPEPTLEQQLGVFDGLAEKAVADLRRFHADARERFVEGYHLHKNSWRHRDLGAEEREEKLDAHNYRVMAKIKARYGVGEE